MSMAITIKHLEGPLAGQEQHFDDSIGKIMFGRSVEEAQVVYPPSCSVVGVRHFELVRSPAGDYSVGLFGKRFVSIDGHPVINGAVVKSGMTFRLGSATGPSFQAEIKTGAQTGYLKTEDQSDMPDTGDWIRRLGRNAAIGVGGLAALLLLWGGYNIYLNRIHQQELAAIKTDLDGISAEARAKAKKEFDRKSLEQAAKAVYLVIKKVGPSVEPMGSAWAFAPDKLATNAHVVEPIERAESLYFLVQVSEDGKASAEIPIKAVSIHPGYGAFRAFKNSIGTALWKDFTPLDLITQYDVGIIYPAEPLPNDPATGAPATLDLATDADLKDLSLSTAVATIGYPLEGLKGKSTKTHAPANLHFGYISALTDVFMTSADAEHRLLIQHSAPVSGGASGSPLMIAKDGKPVVIGLITGGNVTMFKDDKAVGAVQRIPSAAQINFAARVDLLSALDDGTAAEQLTAEGKYWDEASKRLDFDRYFDTAAKVFVDTTAERYGIEEPAKIETIGKGKLDPGDAEMAKFVQATYPFKAEPGHLYGFIANAESGVPIVINLKRHGTSDYVRDKMDPRETNDHGLAPTAWVSEPMDLDIIVSTRTEMPAEYELKVYDWARPQPPSAQAGSASGPQ
jgi:hypothetical protein